MIRQTILALSLILSASSALAQEAPVGVVAETAAASKMNCGETDPDCSRRLLFIMNGIHIGQTQVDAGYRFGNSEADVAIGFKAKVLSIDSSIGDLAAIPFEATYFPELGGVRVRIALVDADVLFFCKDQSGKTHLPLMGLFQDCQPTAFLGLGATVLENQWDSDTGRDAMRWAEINLVLSFLRNGNSFDYLHHRLSAFAGASLDTVWPDSTPGALGGRSTTARLNFGVMGMLRSQSNKLEIRGYAGYRPSVTDFTDSGYEAKVDLMYHLLFSNKRTLGTVGLEGGATQWNQPWKSMGSVASATDPRTYFLRVMFRMIFQ